VRVLGDLLRAKKKTGINDQGEGQYDRRINAHERETRRERETQGESE